MRSLRVSMIGVYRIHGAAVESVEINRGLVGTRVPPSQGRRSEQRSLLVQSGWEARLPRTARCGMAQHRERFATQERWVTS
jgi:hypothetical protein